MTTENEDVSTLPLSMLRFGHEHPGMVLNCRVANRDEGLDELAASIKHEGIIQSLLVTPSVDRQCYYVVGGNRRLAAARLLVERNELDGDYMAPVIIREGLTETDALRLSLAENVHVPLHPVDRFEAFSACHSNGDNLTDIAQRYAVPQRVVRQSLALGQLSPTIRNAWRKGDIDAEAAEAFTLESDQAAQDKIFKRLSKSHDLDEWNIRRELMGDQRNVDRNLAFVGEKDYRAKGGEIVEDLFGTSKFVSDPAMLAQLANEKIKEKCEKLVAQGWGWASLEGDLPQSARYTWPRVCKKTATAEEKSKAGCIVCLSHKGKLEVEYGFTKPSKGKKTGAKNAAVDNDGAPEGDQEEQSLPMSLIADLSSVLTQSAAEAVRADEETALAIMIAGFMCGGIGPVKVYVKGMVNAVSQDHVEFHSAMIIAQGWSHKEKIKYLALVASSAIDMRVSGKEHALLDEDNVDLCYALHRAELQERLISNFDSGAYMKSAPKEACLKAIAETQGEHAAQALKTKTKKQIAMANRGNIVLKRWLPPELRTAHYTTPAAED